MSLFTLSKCDSVVGFCWPEDHRYLSLRSPARLLMTDFTVQRPLVIDANTKAVEAAYLMKKAHVKMRFVVDNQLNFVGVITSTDLSQQNIIQRVADGFDRHDLRVSDFMKKRSELVSIALSELAHSSVNRLLTSFKRYDEPYILVTSDDNTKLSGIVTLHDIAKHFRLPDGYPEPASFNDWLALLNADIAQPEGIKDSA
ncbi:CBS domain-containing protein [Alteromonas flava]|uniref:CBS domain-containing protein n=1 Tax=Alteromonas flava TaxID=2048003 RepID=UPI000C28A902|nr:CBS domain-containing protein [Alteromonas flava]